jgi:hypothetical protein
MLALVQAMWMGIVHLGKGDTLTSLIKSVSDDASSEDLKLCTVGGGLRSSSQTSFSHWGDGGGGEGEEFLPKATCTAPAKALPVGFHSPGANKVV